jgi:hypothetical protein
MKFPNKEKRLQNLFLGDTLFFKTLYKKDS